MVHDAFLKERREAATQVPASVAESRFGEWFLTTETWRKYVLESAFESVTAQIGVQPIRAARILDAGCGGGPAFALLHRRFHPQVIYGVDIDPAMVALANAEARSCGCRVEIVMSRAGDLPFPDEALDLIFCHQTVHHVTNQEQVLADFYRVLRPGGVLLLCESLRAFIQSFKVRMLFRHPDRVQRTAEGYLEMLRAAGFSFAPENISTPDPFWARPSFGIYDSLRENLGLGARQRALTQLNVAAFRRS